MAATPKPQPDPRGVSGLYGYPPTPTPRTLKRVAYDAGYWLCRARFAVAPLLLRWYNARDEWRGGYGDGRRTAVWQLRDGTLERKATDRAA